ncbi:MAG: hypothetical protein PVF05_09395 [Gemmatimonadales bacterium]|jgi:hypothetical protein
MQPARALRFAILCFVAGACQDESSPFAPAQESPDVATADGSPLDAISDAVRGGNAHFFWLPPMVGHPDEFNGPFDGTLEAVVTICELSDCVGTTIAQLSVAGGGVTIEDETYRAEWDTGASDATDGTTYRAAVSVAGTRIGFADVVLAATGGEAKNLTTGETIGLKDGRTLPIKFRLEEGVAFVVDPAVGQTIAALDGEVEVEVPPGALTTETAITVEESEPTGSALTSITFGPAGTTFSEPVPVTIGYDPAALPPGVAESDLALNLLDDQGRWIVLPGSQVDEATDEVTAPFHHFSTGGAGPAELAIFCPGDGIPETFELLEDAVAAVMAGGTIEVCDGTHTVSNVTVDKAVTFEGAAGTLPTITTGGDRFGVTFTSASGTTTIRNLRFETLWNLGFDHFVGSALRVGGTGPLPYDQVVIEDVELHVADGSSGENAGSGAWIFGSDVAGAHVTVRNVTSTAGGAGLYILTLSEATRGASVDVQNSSFSSPGRYGILVTSLSVNSASGAISDVDIDNVDVTANLGVYVTGGNGGVGGRVDVTNSSFSGGALWYQSGGTGLIQNNTIDCAHGSACIRVRSDGGSSQVEPVRIIGNQITPLNASHARAIWLTELDAGPFEVRDNVISGSITGGDRSDPATYTFGEGILFHFLEAGGEVTGNTISGTFVTFSAEGGTASASVDDNTASQSWAPVSVVNGAQMTAHSNDFTDYQAAIDANEPFGTGDLTCNWWGASTGPTGLFPSIAADVYTPWATAPVAGTSTTICSGGP